MRYINPLSGDYAMSTIGTFMQMLPAGFTTQAFRSADATVFVVVEGQGKSVIGDLEFNRTPHDIVVVPSGFPVTHVASSDSMLFSYSDRPVQQKLGLWRESRL